MNRDERGSVFLDSVVALAIVVMTLGMTFQVVADTASRQRGVEARRAALLVAQSELAAVGAEIPIQQGQSAGVAGAFAWRVAMAPYDIDRTASMAGPLMRIDVSVRARNGGPELASLHSLRLVRNS
jgi:hypothetical protein